MFLLQPLYSFFLRSVFIQDDSKGSPSGGKGCPCFTLDQLIRLEEKSDYVDCSKFGEKTLDVEFGVDYKNIADACSGPRCRGGDEAGALRCAFQYDKKGIDILKKHISEKENEACQLLLKEVCGPMHSRD
jgi:hypothetical protein